MPKKVMIVEDDPLNRRLFTDVLVSEGFEGSLALEGIDGDSGDVQVATAIAEPLAAEDHAELATVDLGELIAQLGKQPRCAALERIDAIENRMHEDFLHAGRSSGLGGLHDGAMQAVHTRVRNQARQVHDTCIDTRLPTSVCGPASIVEGIADAFGHARHDDAGSDGEVSGFRVAHLTGL